MFGSIHLCSSLLDTITVSILGDIKTVVMVLENFQVDFTPPNEKTSGLNERYNKLKE